MTAPERPAFVRGELVSVEIRAAVVLDLRAAGWLQVRVAGVEFMLPVSDRDVTIARQAPADWPPLVGDLWRDDEDHLWFAQVKAARYGDGGRVSESARLLMAPAVETPNIYQEQRYSPDDFIAQRGPVRLVHREPQPADDPDKDA